jgi:hypothetical protein
MKRFAVTLIVPVLLFSVALGQQTKVLTDNAGVASSLRLLEKWVASQMEYRNQPGISMGIVHHQALHQHGDLAAAGRRQAPSR